MYVLLRCDGAGVWNPDFELAEFQIGEAINWPELVKGSNGNIEVLPDGKWWLVDYVAFQYGGLSWECKPHRPVILLLEKHGLQERVSIPFHKGSKTLEEKEEDKDKEKEKEKEKEKKPREKKNYEYARDDLPEKIRNDAFEKAWLDWIDYRRKKGVTVLDKTMQEQLVYLAIQPDAIAVIRTSIRNGWQGLFEIKDQGNGKRNNNGQSGATREIPDQFRRPILELPVEQRAAALRKIGVNPERYDLEQLVPT